MNEGFVWFSDEDNEILGDQICSRCRRDMPEDECPIMLFAEQHGKTYIARFHHDCFGELIKAGILKLGKIQ